MLLGASQCEGSSLPGLLQLEILYLVDLWHCLLGLLGLHLNGQSTVACCLGKSLYQWTRIQTWCYTIRTVGDVMSGVFLIVSQSIEIRKGFFPRSNYFNLFFPD